MTPPRAPHSPEIVNGKVVSAVDWVGTRFAIGDHVLYCVGVGNSYIMAIGEVTQMKSTVVYEKRLRDPEPGEEPDWHPYCRTSSPLYNIGAKVIEKVPYERISVQVRTLRTSSGQDHRRRNAPSWVKAENITVLNVVEVP